MYKTVRHGENSLQYKILAQQEEGVANIKYRKSPRTVTGKLITIIVLLIIGIIASAVLVPLVLTNDFIALTGTFQKFSVSTLRRSHSGNHVVVIAKKPYGWNALHSSPPPRLSSASLGHSINPKKVTVEAEFPKTTSEPTSTTRKATKAVTSVNRVTTELPAADRRTSHPSTERAAESVSDAAAGEETGRRGAHESSISAAAKNEGFASSKAGTDGAAPPPAIQKSEGGKISSTAGPLWFDPVKKWGLEPSGNFISGMNGVVTNPVSVLGSFLFVLVVVVMFFILKKTLPKRKTSLLEKESAESQEHKTRLLKPSVSSDHDEE